MEVLSPTSEGASDVARDYAVITSDSPARFRTVDMLMQAEEFKRRDSERRCLQGRLRVLEPVQLGTAVICLGFAVANYAKGRRLVWANLAVCCGNVMLWFAIRKHRGRIQQHDEKNQLIKTAIKLEIRLKLALLTEHMWENDLRLTSEQHSRIKDELGSGAKEDLGVDLENDDFGVILPHEKRTS